MPYRTFFCYANSTQEAEEWIKILQWKLVGTLIQSDYLIHKDTNLLSSNCALLFNTLNPTGKSATENPHIHVCVLWWPF